ncbi:hypothetical protein GGS20DRAFT_567087 [Poronia punctata]|nr:hypothetical protein GGS20DRAFT_567087 [Poronia punctata]
MDVRIPLLHFPFSFLLPSTHSVQSVLTCNPALFFCLYRLVFPSPRNTPVILDLGPITPPNTMATPLSPTIGKMVSECLRSKDANLNFVI